MNKNIVSEVKWVALVDFSQTLVELSKMNGLEIGHIYRLYLGEDISVYQTTQLMPLICGRRTRTQYHNVTRGLASTLIYRLS